MKTEFKWSHIILADDDDDDCSFFTEALTMLHPGVKVSVENNGIKLMEYLCLPPQPEADIIFLDLNMPVKSGIDCLQDIRNDKRLKNSVIIMLTTSSHHADIEDSYKLGANFFVTKPMSFSGLCGIINKVLASVVHYGAQQPPRENFVVSS